MAAPQVGTVGIGVEVDASGVPKDLQKQLKGDSTFEKIGDAIGTTIGTTMKVGFAAAATAVGVGVGAALTKGMGRLTAIDNAKAKLEGLKFSAEAIESTMDSALKAVKNTAFGLGDAATIAGIFAATGIQAGEDMTRALKLTADAATVGGTSLADMGDVLSDVSAMGKVTGDTLNRMGERGIDALGMIATQMGVNRDEARKMVSKGEIDFNEFAAAMEANIGGAALSSGKTYQGAMANIGAATGRLGAVALQPFFDGMVALAPKIIGVVDRITAALKPLMEAIGPKVTAAFEAIGAVLDKITFKGADELQAGGEGLANMGSALIPLIPLLGLFGGLLGPITEGIPILGKLFTGLSGPIGLVAVAVGLLLAVKPETLATGFENLASMLPQIIEKIVTTITSVIPTLIQNLAANIPILLTGIVNLVTSLVPALANIVVLLVQTLLGAIPQVISGLLGGIPDLLRAALGLFNTLIDAVVTMVPQLLKAVITIIPQIITALVSQIPAIAVAAVQLLSGLVDGIAQAIPDIIGAVATLVPQIITLLVAQVPMLLNTAINLFQTLVNALLRVVPELLTLVVDLIPLVMDAVIGMIPQLLNAALLLWSSLADALVRIIPKLITAIMDLVPKVIETLIGLIPALIDAAVSLFQSLVDGLLTTIPVIIDVLVNQWIPMLIETIISMVPKLIEAAIALFMSLVDAVADAIPAIIEGVLELLPPLIESILAMIPPLIDAAIDLFLSLVEGVIQALPQVIDAVVEMLPPLIETITGMIPQLIDAAVNLFLGIVEGLTQAIQPIVDALFTMLPILLDALIEMYPQLLDAAITLFMGLMQGLTEALPDVITALMDILPSLINGLLGMIPILIPAAIQLFLSLVTGLIQALPQIIGAIIELVPLIIGALIEAAPALIGAGLQLIGALIGGVLDGLAKFFEPVTNLFKGIADAIAGAFTWLYENVLKPVFDAIGAVFQWLWENIISPIVTYIVNNVRFWAAIFKWLWEHAIQPAIQAIGDAFTWLWEEVISPVFDFIGDIFDWIWKQVIQPIVDYIVDYIEMWGDIFQWLYDNVVAPVFKAIGDAFTWIWETIIQPVVDFIVGAFETLGDTFTWLYENVIKPVWEGIQDAFESAWNWINDNVFTPFGNAIGAIQTAFENVANALPAIWDSIKKAVGEPINFVLETIWNNGLRSFWNDLVTELDLKDMKLPKAKLVSFARGGILPGYTPGRDVHQFWSPTGGRLALSGGEGIIRPDALRRLGGKKWLDAINGSRGRAIGDGQGDKSKGFLGDAFAWVADAVQVVGDFLLNPVKAIDKYLVQGLIRDKMGDQNIFGQTIAGLAANTVKGLAHAFDILAPSDGKDAPANALGWQRMWAMVQRVAPWAVMTSGYRSPATNAAAGGVKGSYHTQGRAIDLVPASMKTFNMAKALFPNARELIYTPAGNAQLRNGQPFSGWSDYVKKIHNNHIHVAMKNGGIFDDGGWLQPGGLGMNLGRRPEAVFTDEQFRTLERNVIQMDSILNAQRGYRPPSLSGSGTPPITGYGTSNSQAITVEAGAVQVIGPDPYRAALEVGDRLAERIGAVAA